MHILKEGIHMYPAYSILLTLRECFCLARKQGGAQLMVKMERIAGLSRAGFMCYLFHWYVRVVQCIQRVNFIMNYLLKNVLCSIFHSDMKFSSCSCSINCFDDFDTDDIITRNKFYGPNYLKFKNSNFINSFILINVVNIF